MSTKTIRKSKPKLKKVPTLQQRKVELEAERKQMLRNLDANAGAIKILELLIAEGEKDAKKEA